MNNFSGSLPSRQWSIVALSSTSMAIVVLSYLLAVILAVACLLLPILFFVLIPIDGGNMMFGRVLLSAFGLAVGASVIVSLVPKKEELKVNGVPIDLKHEPRLAQEIETIAKALKEPMPHDVYLIGDANAFVSEAGGRRVLGLGLPLLQMLSIAQFRAVLAHEFAHYYGGDTRIGPWVYNARKTMGRVYESLGRQSGLLKFLRRWAIVYVPYMALMGVLRFYWQFFTRVTQAISRRQEFRCDELACHIAGSQSLIGGLQNIRKCASALSPYWNNFVLPAAARGYKPELGAGFQRFMQAPQIAKTTTEFLAQQIAIAKPEPLDSHPTLSQRVQRAKSYNLPAPEAALDENSRPMISLIDELHGLETGLLKRLLPSAAKTDFKPLNWEDSATDVYIPSWRRNIEVFSRALAAKRMSDFALLASDPRPLAECIPVPAGKRVNPAQRLSQALNGLYCALALCLIDNGWKLISVPGDIHLEKDGQTVEPSEVIAAIRAGKLSVAEWQNFRAQEGIEDWPLAAPVNTPVSV